VHHRISTYNVRNDFTSRSTTSYANANELERDRRLRVPARSRARTSTAHGRSESLPSTGEDQGIFQRGRPDERHTRAESQLNSSVFSRQPDSVSEDARRVWQYSNLPVEPSAFDIRLRPLYYPVENGIPRRPPTGLSPTPSIDCFRSWRRMPPVPEHYPMHHDTCGLPLSNMNTPPTQLLHTSSCDGRPLAEERSLPSISAIETTKDLSAYGHSTSAQKHESGASCTKGRHRQDRAEYLASKGLPNLRGLASAGGHVRDVPAQAAGSIERDLDIPDHGSKSLSIKLQAEVANVSGACLAKNNPSNASFCGSLQNLADASEVSLKKQSQASPASAVEIDLLNPSQKVHTEVVADLAKPTTGSLNVAKNDDLSLWNSRDQLVLEGAFLASGGRVNGDVAVRLSSYLGRTVDHIESWFEEQRCRRK
jgi:hypothetical protein